MKIIPKKLTSNPILFLTTANILVSLSLLIGFLGLKSLKGNFFIVRTSLDQRIIKNYKTSPLVKGEKIIGEFTAPENYLGAIRIKFDMKQKIVNDTVIFRIKKKGDKNWYFKSKYDARLFTGMKDYPFGFPPIKNSKGKTFIFELQSLKGSPEEGVRFSTTEPLITLEFQVPIKELLSNPKHLVRNIAYPLSWVIFLVFIGELILLYLFAKNYLSKINWPALILVYGVLIRLILLFSPITFDLSQFEKSLNIFKNGGNIYLQQKFYNYSPLFLYLLSITSLPFQLFNLPGWLAIRITVITFDLLIFYLLLKILKLKKLPSYLTALFFLNPVVYIVSAHHTQFDNIAIFFLLWAYFLYLKKESIRHSTLKIFILLTLSLTIKHIVLFFTLAAFVAFFGKRKGFILFSLSLILFLLSFLPYLITSFPAIKQNVFSYSANPFVYGIGLGLTNLRIKFPIFQKLGFYYRYLFFLIMFSFPFIIGHDKNPIKTILASILLFLVLTPGVQSHYFALPIAIASLSPSKEFLGYSLAVGTFYLTFYAELSPLNIIPISAIWIFALYWFIIFMFENSFILKWIKIKR